MSHTITDPRVGGADKLVFGWQSTTECGSHADFAKYVNTTHNLGYVMVFNYRMGLSFISKTARSCYAQPPFPNVVADFLHV
jgi:hypothetical protein